MRIWGYEDMRIWGYKDMRIWGYEDMRIWGLRMMTLRKVAWSSYRGSMCEKSRVNVSSGIESSFETSSRNHWGWFINLNFMLFILSISFIYFLIGSSFETSSRNHWGYWAYCECWLWYWWWGCWGYSCWLCDFEVSGRCRAAWQLKKMSKIEMLKKS